MILLHSLFFACLLHIDSYKVSFLQHIANQERILFIGAHPDDEIFAGPLLARASERCEVRAVCMTRGEGGINLVPMNENQTIGAVRESEFFASCQILGVVGVSLDFPNGFENDIHNPLGQSESVDQVISRWKQSGNDPYEAIVREIRDFRPTIVMSFDSEQGFTGHREHKALGKIVVSSFAYADDYRKYPEHFREGLKVWPAKYLYAVVNTRPDLIDKKVAEIPSSKITEIIDSKNVSEDGVRSYLQIALQAWSMHKSQFGASPLTSSYRRKIEAMIEKTALVLVGTNRT